MTSMSKIKQGGTATPAVAEPVVDFSKVGASTRRATGSGAKPFWYLDRDADLSNVTAEDNNTLLGINKIYIWEPTEGQRKAGILCKVTLDSVVAKIDNISIFPSKFEAGDIYLQMGGGRNVAGEGEKEKWVRDCKLTAAARAQILSFVHSLLKK